MTSWLRLPQLASQHGAALDHTLGLVHVLMLVLFVGWGAFFALRARGASARKRNPVADHTGVTSHASTWLEGAVAVVEAILLVGFSIPLWADRVRALPAAGGRRRACAWWPSSSPGTSTTRAPTASSARTDAKLVDAQSNPLGPRPRATPRPRTTSRRSTSCTCRWAGRRSSSSRSKDVIHSLRPAGDARQAGRDPGHDDPGLVRARP